MNAHCHCHTCDRPVDEPRGGYRGRPHCPSIEGVEWHSRENLDRCGCEGRVAVTDAQGHRWEALHFVESGTMFVSMSVDGHDIMEPHTSVYIGDDGAPRFAGTEPHETLRQVFGEEEDYDNLDDYHRRYEEYEAGKALLIAELAELAKMTLSPVFDGSVWDEMLDGERRHREQARKDAMDRLMYRVEENLYSDFDSPQLTNEEKAAVLRKVAERLEV